MFSLLGVAAAFSPQPSGIFFEKMVPLIIASFLIKSNFPFCYEELASSSVKAGVMKSIMIDTATNSVYLTCTEIMQESSSIFLSCDKEHSCGAGHFVKKISWWSE